MFNRKKCLQVNYLYYGVLLISFPFFEIFLLAFHNTHNSSISLEERRWFLCVFPFLAFLILSKIESWIKNSFWKRFDKILILTFVIIPLIGILFKVDNGGINEAGVPAGVIFIFGIMHVPSIVYFVLRGAFFSGIALFTSSSDD